MESGLANPPGTESRHVIDDSHNLWMGYQTGTSAERGRRSRRQARERGFHPRPLEGNNGYDTWGCLGAWAPVGSPRTWRKTRAASSSAIDGGTPRHQDYALSQRLRKRVEEIFGWMKTVDALPTSGPHGPCRVPRGDSLQPGTDGQADDC